MAERLDVTFNAGSSSLRCGDFRLTQDGPLRIRNHHIRGLPSEMIPTQKDMLAGTRKETRLGTPESAAPAHPEARFSPVPFKFTVPKTAKISNNLTSTGGAASGRISNLADRRAGACSSGCHI